MNGQIIAILSPDKWYVNVFTFKLCFSETELIATLNPYPMLLVHMGGRVYDPILGRWLKTNTVIRAPKNSE
jgi:hypothetical protein